MNAKKRKELEELLTHSKNALNKSHLSKHNTEVFKNFISLMTKENKSSLIEVALLVNSIINHMIHKDNNTISSALISNLSLVISCLKPSKEYQMFITSSLLDISTSMNIPLPDVRLLFNLVHGIVFLQDELGIEAPKEKA